uniref:Ribonuclease P n=1 Tax=Saccharum hybrid cultivar R570 TaxID=131158 RepID=A0A059Q053_9POAL|nr:ribonuclease P [Saccharum hybrid cultivar R570]
MSKKRKSLNPDNSLKDSEQVLASDFIRGDDLDDLLSKLVSSVESAKASRGGLPEKIWMKQQFAIGVNDVTRVLERMPHSVTASHSTQRSSEAPTVSGRPQAPLVPLQAVLVAADCNPKWLTKHIPTLASTRQVPVLCLKDNKGASLRLGHVVNVRTALAIGVKARDSIVNKTIDEVLKDSKLVANEQTPSSVTCLD